MRSGSTKTIIALFALSLISASPAFAGSATWDLAPGSGDWNTAANWTPMTVPNGTADTATFDLSLTPAVSISSNTEVNGIVFSAGHFTITASPTFTLTLSGTGVTNSSGITQNFVTAVDGAGNRGTISFTNSATAGSITAFTNDGATVSGALGGTTEFHNTSTAGNGTFTNNAGTVSGANGGATHFFDTSTAGNGTFTTNGAAVSGALEGEINFFNTSTAGNGTFTNSGASVSGGIGGRTEVTGSATAGSGTFTNNGGTVSGAGGGFTEFFTNSATGAGNGTFTNNGGAVSGASGGFTEFHATSTAGHGTFITNGGMVFNALGGITKFVDSATAGNGTFTTNGGAPSGIFSGGVTEFFNTSTAGNGTFTTNGGAVMNAAGGEMDFFDTSTAGHGTFTNNGGTLSGASGGVMIFHTNSTAGNGTFTTNAGTVSGAFGAEMDFLDSSTAGNGSFTTNGAAVSGAGGGTMEFHNTSTAANGTFTTNGGTVSGANGGTMEFDESSTAANGIFTTNGGTIAGALGGNTQFFDSSTAGGATLIANGFGAGAGGSIQFIAASTGGTAIVIVAFKGNLDISQHNLPGLTIGSIEGNGNVFLGANNLTVGSNNLSRTFSGVIQDGGLGGGTGGSLTKIGTGTLILSNTNTYTGNTNINAGVLQVDGSIASPDTFANPGGTLRGTGTLGGNLTNSGLVGPGDSPGTLTVNGNYTQNSNGTLQIQIGGTAAGQHDLLSIGGTASLNGTLQLVRLNNFTGAPGDKIIFLTATGGVSGTFATVNTGTIANAIVVYEANDVALEFTQVSFASLTGLTPNQQSVAHEFDEVANDSRASQLIAFLTSEPLANLPHDFDLIAPEELASIYEISFSQAVVLGANLQRRMDDIRAGSSGYCGPVVEINPVQDKNVVSDKNVSKNVAPAFVPAPENHWGMFIIGTGDYIHVGNEDDNAHGYNLSTGAITAGLDYRLLHNLAVGIYGGFVGDDADLVGHGRITMAGGNVGGYATWSWSGFYVDAAGGGSWNNYDTRREALLGEAHGSTDGDEVNAMGAIGYDWKHDFGKPGCLNIGPLVSFQYTNVSINRYTEQGSLAPLEIQDQSEDSLRSTVGMRASLDIKTDHGVIVRPEVRASWLHEYGDQAYPIDSRLASGAGDIFRVWGPTIGENAALVSAGVTVQFNSMVSVFGFYDGVFGRDNYDNNSVSGGFRLSF